MTLNETIREAAKLAAFNENQDYLRGVCDIIARAFPTELNDMNVDPGNRAYAVESLIREELTPLAVTDVRLYYDQNSDPQYIDVRTVVSSNRGVWVRTKTLDTDDDTWSTSNTDYTHPDGTLKENLSEADLPRLVVNIFKSVAETPVGMIRSIVAQRQET